MFINADHYVTGKSRHRLCEDYAVSGLSPVPYLILSDGCSSSPGSHLGAMLLTRAAAGQIRKRFTEGKASAYADFGRSVAYRAALMARLMELPETVLDATLMVAWCADDMVTVRVYGDGFITLVKSAETEPEVIEIAFETNAPFYLSYGLNTDRAAQYRREMEGVKRIRRGDDPPASVAFDAPVEYTFPASEYTAVALASDGVGALTDRSAPEAGHISPDEVLGELTAFKNVNGAFVQRRARKAITSWEKRNIVTTDDLSFAALWLGEETP